MYTIWGKNQKKALACRKYLAKDGRWYIKSRNIESDDFVWIKR